MKKGKLDGVEELWNINGLIDSKTVWEDGKCVKEIIGKCH